MSYAAQEDLEARYGVQEVQVVSDRNQTGQSDTAAILKALASASAEIDSYVGAHYELPLAVTPDVIIDRCCEIGMYRMATEAGTLTDEKRTRYEDAIKWLTLLAKGTVSLGLEPDEAVAEDTPEISITMTSAARLMTRAKLGGVL